MCSLPLRAAPALLAVVLGGCDVTTPWTTERATAGGAFGVSPASLSFAGQAGGATPGAQRLDVTIGAGAVYLGVTYSGAVANAVVTAGPAGHAQVEVSVRAPNSAGTFSGTVEIAGCADDVCTTQVPGSPVVVPVTYTVTALTGPTALQTSPTSLVFAAAAGGADPAPQTITLSEQGGGSSAWYSCIATSDLPLTWVSWTPSTGATLPATIQVSAHGSGLSAGTTRSGTLILQTVPCSQSATNTVSVPITFTITP
jgi:hypothetical protein